MLRGVIFDLDGVICFTDEYHYLAWKELADREHIYFDREINNRLRGVSRMASLEIILERADKAHTLEEKETMAAAKNDAYRSLLTRMTPADVTEEARQTLETLRRKGMRLAIGSSSRNARLILGRIGLTEFFDAISDGNNIAHSKPDPEVFLKAAQMLELEPEECLVVEDAQAGIQAAHDGGFHNAAMGDAVKCELAENLLSSFSDLLKLC
ncbi:Beta-phosphoglucomutase [uncultured Eubacteriales bacterium]|uniref:Beta-phosphoglucomutase n=1 Tax=uncultured Eubacteriales bacterium TaxID=172733 RepID=A0A212KG93_9FIRM|nr:Beta-phosphoglucomutase [uncultured Eubacteriales bacterium]